MIAPPPPPEEPRLTDEQLKSRFGIHLASRLDEDANKGAKWADIDEDDDDWVPQKIEWADGGSLGTASPVRKADSPPPPAPQARKPEPEPVKVAEPVVPPVRQATPILAPSRQTTPVLATKLSGKPKTLVTEKTTAKVTDGAASTAPKASPWAKIVVPTSPVVTAPALPVQRPQVFERHERHEERPREAYQTAEVSAEGYDRAWRDRRGSANQRELFNSQTGQMEPVTDGPARNARVPRNEAPLSKPAVLQRPSPTTTGPAEPSSAFQQSRVPMRQDDYRRRRTSSNVSGGSGSMGRRQSFTRYGGVDPLTPDEHGFAQSRYTSVFEDGPLHPRAPPGSHPSPLVQHREISPSLRHVQPVAVPSVTPVAALPSPTQSSAQPVPADPIALIAEQERIMRESREQARKRRQEEEAQEEAAKKERLAAKIAALDAKKAESDRIEAEKAKAIEDKRREEEEKKAAAAAEAAAIVAEAEAEAAKARVAAEAEAAAAKQREAEREQQQQQRALDERQATTIAAAEQRGAHQPLNNHHQSLADTANHHTLHQPQQHHQQLPSSGDGSNSNMPRHDPRFGAGHHQTDPALRPDFPNLNQQPQLHTQQQPMMQAPRYRAPQHNSPWARSGRDYNGNAPRENNYNGYAPGPAYGPQSRNHNPLPFNAGRNDQAVYNSPGMHGGLPPPNTSHPPPQALHAANQPPLAHNQNYDRRPQPFNDHHDSRGLQGNTAAAPMPGHGEGGGNLRDPRRQDVLPNGNNNRSFGPIGQRSDNFVSRNVPKRDGRGTPPPPQNAQQALAATKWGNVVDDLSSTNESRQIQAAPRKAPQFGGTLKPTAVGKDIPAWQEAPAPSMVFTKGHEFNDPNIKKKDIDATAIAAKAAAAKWAAENLIPQFAHGKAKTSEANTNDAGIIETDINETNIPHLQATEANATEANPIEARPPVQKVSRIFPGKEPRSQSPPPPMSAEHPVYGDASTRVVQLPSGPKSPRAEKRSSGHDIASVQSQILSLTGKNREKHSRQKEGDGKINTSPRSTYADTTFAASRRPLESSGAAATVQFPTSTSHRVTGNKTERNPRRPENVRSIPTSEDFMNTMFEQEFGSSPTVSLPSVWQTTFTTTSRSDNRGELFTPRPPRRHYQDREPLLERNDNFSERGIPRVAIRLPGQPDVKQLELHNAVPAPPARRNNGRGRGRANNRGNSRSNNRAPRIPINAST